MKKSPTSPVLSDATASNRLTGDDPHEFAPALPLAAPMQDESLRSFLERHAKPLRASVRGAIASLPSEPKNAGELGKLLDIDSSQVWRLWEAAYTDDLSVTALRICGESGLERFLSRMTDNGLASELAERVRTTHMAFENAVKDEIGDQASLRLMLSGVPQSPEADLRYLRAQFDAARWRFGVQAEAHLAMCVRVPSQFDGLVDTSTLIHCEKLRTLRPIASHPIDWLAISETRPKDANDDKNLKRSASVVVPFTGSVPVNGDVPPHGRALNLIPGVGDLNGRSVWCYQHETNVFQNVFSGGNQGKAGESTFCYGHTVLAGSLRYGPSESWAYPTLVSVPAEECVLECFISDEEYKDGMVLRPQVHDLFFKRLESKGMKYATDFVDRPFGHRIEHYPPHRGRPMHKSIPGYARILEATERHIGMPLLNMHLFRWRLKLPPVGMYYVMIAGKPE